MLTYKLRIKECSDKELVAKMQQNYSYAFRKLYSNYDKIKDKKFIKELCLRHNLDSWQFESLKTEVETKVSQVNIIRKENQIKQEEIKEELKLLENNETKKSKRRKFLLNDKLKRLKDFTDVIFGTKVLLRKLSCLSNDKENNKKEIEEVRKQYKENRILPIFIGGETYHNGNRKFVFDLENKKMFFKPERKTKINIEFICSDKQHKVLLKLQDLIEENKILSVTIRLSTDYVWIIFNEIILNGFELKEREMKAELKKVSGDCKEVRKEIARKYYKELDSRKLIGKNSNRYMNIDLNPEYIGWSICDKVNNDIKIIEKGCYDLVELSKKLNLSSDNPKQIYQNNKRKHEICNIFKDLFIKATYYKVANFVMEDLNFKDKNVNEFSREFNRKVRNIWHRTLTCNLITKYCNCLGIQKIEVNPVYTSFIGNIQYEFFDSVNASIEICRRGMYKFVKGAFYPKVTEDDLNTMSRLILKSRDVLDKTELLRKLKSLSNWKDFFNFFHTDGFKVRYRRSLNDCKSFERFSLFSLKSRVLLYKF